MRARGADFSSAQDDAHTRTAVAHGLDFGFVKATEGDGYVNPRLHAQMSALLEHGALAGLYHFAGAHTDGARQFDFFASEAAQYKTRLIAIDHEADEHGVVPPDNVVRAFIRRAHQRGYKVGRYGSSGVMRHSLGEDWKWVAWWSAQPPPFRWDVWQFAAGKHGDPDWNLFNGDVAQLRAFVVRMGGGPGPPRPRWWIHDELTAKALGPYRLARAGPVFVAYAAGHPRSTRYSIERK